ncbi:unnamed protein product [Rotaria magnacalcarata]
MRSLTSPSVRNSTSAQYAGRAIEQFSSQEKIALQIRKDLHIYYVNFVIIIHVYQINLFLVEQNIFSL